MREAWRRVGNVRDHPEVAGLLDARINERATLRSEGRTVRKDCGW